MIRSLGDGVHPKYFYKGDLFIYEAKKAKKFSSEKGAMNAVVRLGTVYDDVYEIVPVYVNP